MCDTAPDPLSGIIALLKPQPSISKMVEAGGVWRVERHDTPSPFYAAIVEGNCVLTVAGRAPVALTAGDFVMIPDLHSFSLSSKTAPPVGAARIPLATGPGTFRLGPPEAEVTMRALVGHCRFAAPGKELLVSLLPEMIHLSGHARLMALVPVIHEETRDTRPARGMMLERLLEILMIEALRSGPTSAGPPGLLRGLADPQLAAALRRIHSDMTSAISVADLARVAGMSRSAFFARFRAEIGATPADYVTTWRMAVARDLLLQGALTNAEIAHRVGYGSASAFGMAFARHQGVSPRGFVEQNAGLAGPILH